jgi:hypothetical protein
MTDVDQVRGNTARHEFISRGVETGVETGNSGNSGNVDAADR